ncbi:MAG: PucR family transcriptional regulator ligand-binding domain-containing protein [Tenericutes bacterium]|nr:PucR family transcriptional regulator ligand-binding domain-containing protein [Mycoplasmatota bacterium]
MITLDKLLNINVIESFEIIAGKDHLNRTVSSVSVLETPEFEKYVIENSLILTTLYPIKQDISLFEKLLHILDEKKVSGIMVKIHRYVDEIPKSIIALADQLHLPIITLNYDANLSTIFNAILSELQGSEFSKSNFASFYSDMLRTIGSEPSIGKLVESVKRIDDLDILIQSPLDDKLYYSSDLIASYYAKYQHPANTLVKDNNHLLYVTNVEYQDEVIYRLALLTGEEKRYILYNYAEIYKMVSIFVYQKKRENFMRQNQFLLGFVSNITSNYNTNEELMEVSKFYNWDVQFPLFLLLFSISGKHKEEQSVHVILRSIVEQLKINQKNVRYIFMDAFILFIVNTSYEANNAAAVEKIYDRVKNEIPDITLKLAYSNPIDQAHEIPKVFAILSKTVNNAKVRMIDLDIFNENHVRLMTLLKTLSYDDLRSFSHPIIGKLLEYEQKTNLPLINTLYKYIQCRFSIKNTAESLFIHPNSLKYRLSVIEKLGYRINNHRSHFFDLYLALYVHINLMENDK